MMATKYNNLASLYEKLEKYEEAEVLYKKSIEIYEEILGKIHPDTLAAYTNLAGLYDNTGRREEAEKMYKKAICAYRKILGDNHPIVKHLESMLNALANINNGEE